MKGRGGEQMLKPEITSKKYQHARILSEGTKHSTYERGNIKHVGVPNIFQVIPRTDIGNGTYVNCVPLV